MGQEYSSLSIEERTQLGLLVTKNLTQRQIAEQLGRAASTISRELARNQHPKRGYLAAGAQQHASQRRVQAKVGVRKLSAQFDTPLEFVRHELQRALSPEQIAGRLKRMHPEDPTQRVSHETIYQAVYMVPRGELRIEIIAQLCQSLAAPPCCSQDSVCWASWEGGARSADALAERLVNRSVLYIN